jgi:exonuclease SbcC
MKILRIRLENLNSLKGRHEIDLTAEPLAGAGLFAITGPTGAGKTTLLDAVTLALYGHAARYGKETNPGNMMSRHCGECSAEVEFEVPAGKHAGVYRAVWQRHRARKKPDGALQPPKRYIYDESGTPITQKINDAERLIVEMIGLDYDRFLRSALLAQGEFARFLKAKSNERAELLESLTGTDIYSTLGMRAHTEFTRLENELKQKEAALGQIEVLDDEERRAMDAALKDGVKQLKKLDGEIKSGEAMLKKIERLSEQRFKAKQAKGKLEQLKQRRAEAAEELDRLRIHRLTMPFADDLVRLDAVETAWSKARKSRESAESEHRDAKVSLIFSNAVLRASAGLSLASANQEAQAAGETVQNEAESAKTAETWLAEHSGDAGLTGQIADITAAVADLKNTRATLAGTWSDWTGAAAETLPNAAEELPENAGALSLSELESCIDGFLSAAENEKSSLEKAGAEAKNQCDLRKDHLGKANLLADLESRRHILKDGDPCPLCGAVEHPYAHGSAPPPEIEKLEAELRKSEDSLEKARDRYRGFVGALKRLADKRAAILKSHRAIAEQASLLAPMLEPLGISTPAAGEETKLNRDLKRREKEYRGRVQQKEAAEKRKAEAERRAKDAKHAVGSLEKLLDSLGDPLPGESDAEIPAADDMPTVPDAEAAREKAEKKEAAIAARLAERRKTEKDAEKQHSESKRVLGSRLSGTDFPDIAALRAARLPGDDAARIEALGKSMETAETETRTLGRSADAEIAELIGQNTLEGDDAEKFKQQHGAAEHRRDELSEAQIRRKTKIEADDKNRALRRDKEKELKAGRDELTVWRRLRDLIGSHDGAKFRRYAQTISLDILVRLANRHLKRLSDRYLIRRDDGDEALNLQIEDLHQAGARRPMASLSGGESFLASLALALGLSELAGRNVRIDSLFIDEGFGSLDPETLETAISALESLRQSGKTVGVISHVSLLKERIATRIAVEKLPGGWSRVEVEGASFSG